MGMKLLSEKELRKIEERFKEGITSQEIIEVLTSNGIKFSEATLRKYVQLGLLPRSRRIGTKGKFKGSKGIYPVSVIRKIIEIKELMEQNYTIEEIINILGESRTKWNELEKSIVELVNSLEKQLEKIKTDPKESHILKKEIQKLSKEILTILKQLQTIESKIQLLYRRKEDGRSGNILTIS